MGSVPLNTFKSIQQLLTEEPENISWTSSRKVCVLKGITGKLGIKVKVFQVLLLLIYTCTIEYLIIYFQNYENGILTCVFFLRACPVLKTLL